MTTLAYYPAVENADQLRDLLSRAAWFLTFSPIDRIFVPLADPALSEQQWQVAQGMDPRIEARFDALRKLVEFVPASEPRAVSRVLEKASFALCWKEPSTHSELDDHLKHSLEGVRVVPVDPHHVRAEGGNYIDISSRLGPGAAQISAVGSANLAAVASRIGLFERAYVLATGPSVARYREFDFANSLGIVCNTVILDDELMAAVRPHFAVIADPIFHFGPSRYAAEFRASLGRAMERYEELNVCLPYKYFPVFASAMPELADRAIAIPFRQDRDFNFDLLSDFELKTTANVLTFMMLPLAATFARRVGILGCDGRPLEEDSYFWRHNPATQLNDQMANIRSVHPGFFKLEYNDYYAEHCEMLADQLNAGEANGLQFESLTDSYIPALRDRSVSAGADLWRARASSVSGPETLTPRLLVLDSTRVGALNATGQLKRNLLAGYHEDAFRQVWVPARGEFSLARSLDDEATDVRLSSDAALAEISAFDPQLIYYRPTLDHHVELHELAVEVADRHHQAGLVTHIMDDWPARLAATDSVRAREVDDQLRRLLLRSDATLSISDKMSVALGERYGIAFEAIANGVEPDIYQAARAAAEGRPGRSQEVVLLRYCGALAKDMTFDTILSVARAVDALQGELSIRFEIYTMPMWRAAFEAALVGLHGTTVNASVQSEDYPELLADADALVLGYNFDAKSVRYIGLSMPNKLPEYLASGTAILAVGPRAANGVEFVRSRGLACCVTEDDHEELVRSVRRLATDEAYRTELGKKGSAFADEHLDIGKIRAKFRSVLNDALRASREPLLLGPFTREQRARVDEGQVLAELVDVESRCGVLFDIGAHHGSSLAPYADAGWTVIAAEPDADNREALTKRFGKHDSVTIDTRAVSDVAATARPFYLSDVSTGISSLLAFHESHDQAATVDVTTVADLLDAHRLDSIDVLKIDVEGLDWNVLKGVPWDRTAPDFIECEFEDRKSTALGYSYRDMADSLVERGYAVYLSEWHPIVRYGTRHEWRQLLRYPCRLGSPDAWGNILAFRQDPGAEALTEAFSKFVEVAGPPSPPADPRTGSRVPSESLRSATGPQDPADPDDTTRSLPKAVPPGASSGAVETGAPPASRYDRVYEWARTRSVPLFLVGRLLAWSLRRVQNHPLLAVGPLALLACLLAVALWGNAPYSTVAALGAGLLFVLGLSLVSVGFGGFLLAEFRDEVQIQRRGADRRMGRAEEQLRLGHAARRALEAQIAELGSRYGATAEALEAKISQLETERADASEALGTRLTSLETAEKLTLSEMDAKAQAVASELRSDLSLRLARAHARSSKLDEVVVLIAAERSGSTWLFDLLRVHPNAVFYPTADIYRELGVGGGRYPMHLSNGADASLDIEIRDGVGACVPVWSAEFPELDHRQLAGIEKVHPSAIRFDVSAFLERATTLEKARPVRYCYLTREPIDSIRSFLAYVERAPSWHGDAPKAAEAELYERSYEAMYALASARPGPVVQYEDLLADPITTLSQLYGALWPDVADLQAHTVIAAKAVAMTGSERRRNLQTGPFLGAADPPGSSELEILLGMNGARDPARGRAAIQRCQQLRIEILQLRDGNP